MSGRAMSRRHAPSTAPILSMATSSCLIRLPKSGDYNQPLPHPISHIRRELTLPLSRGTMESMEARALKPDTRAPWAEIVPGLGPMTVDDLVNWPEDDGWRYELVEGVLVRVAGSRPKAVRITDRLYRALGNYIDAHGLGQTTPPDAVYDFEHTGQPNTGLLPDIGFYYAAREAQVEEDQPYPFAPDLAVEIASPSQKQDALSAKARRDLAGG